MEHFDFKLNINKALLFDQSLKEYYENEPSFYSYIGINYNRNDILSLKFYYVFFESTKLRVNFPIKELANEFELALKNIPRQAFLFGSNGGGITLTFKVNSIGNNSIGFYLRQNGRNEKYVSNIISLYPELNLNESDFEDGFGQYYLLNDNIKEEKQYVYLKPTSKLILLENKYGINYSNARGVEISSANSSKIFEHKFIALGGQELFNDTFVNNVPEEFLKIINDLKSKMICPATTIDNSINTCYTYKSNCNLVIDFLNEL